MKLQNFSFTLSQGYARACLLAIAGGYLMLMFVLQHLLPARFSFDARHLTSLIEAGEPGQTGSFALTSRVLGFFPEPVLNILIAALGLTVIVITLRTKRQLLSLAVGAILLLPLLTMSLMRPQKEVLVVALSLAVGWFIMRLSSRSARHIALWAMVAIVAAYGLYGGFIRPYYLLILWTFCALFIFQSVPAFVRILLMLLGAMAVLLLPQDVYHVLQSPRDNINFYRLDNLANNRTMFFNLYQQPDNLVVFTLNYLYAFARLNLPLLFSVAPSEVFLQATIIIYGYLLWLQWQTGRVQERIFALLFLSHALVLTLFEPDLGSYLRHISSVMVYLVPGLHLLEKRCTKTNA